MFEHGFGAQKAGGERDGDDSPFVQLAGHGKGQAYHRDFHQVVKNISAVIERIAIGDFENNGAAAAEHQRNGVVRSDDVRIDGLLQHVQAVLEIDLPEGLAEFGEGVAAPYVIHENVEVLVAPFDCGDELADLGRLGVVNFYGDAVAACGGDEFGGFFDRFWTAGCRRLALSVFPGTASGAVNRCTGLAQCDCNSAAGTASGSGD